jgi:hypothetical protein
VQATYVYGKDLMTTKEDELDGMIGKLQTSSTTKFERIASIFAKCVRVCVEGMCFSRVGLGESRADGRP